MGQGRGRRTGRARDPDRGGRGGSYPAEPLRLSRFLRVGAETNFFRHKVIGKRELRKFVSLCPRHTPLASLPAPSDAEALSGALAKDECLVCISPLHFRPLFGPPQQEMGEPRSGASLYFAYYNFCRVHSSIKATPAVKAGLAVETWSLARDHWLTISDPSAEPNGALIFALTGYGSGRFCARRVWACKLSSRRRRVENRDRQPTKVSDVERKQPGDCVALHRCHKTNVMRPEANHAMGLHECQPEFA